MCSTVIGCLASVYMYLQLLDLAVCQAQSLLYTALSFFSQCPKFCLSTEPNYPTHIECVHSMHMLLKCTEIIFIAVIGYFLACS